MSQLKPRVDVYYSAQAEGNGSRIIISSSFFNAQILPPFSIFPTWVLFSNIRPQLSQSPIVSSRLHLTSFPHVFEGQTQLAFLISNSGLWEWSYSSRLRRRAYHYWQKCKISYELLRYSKGRISWVGIRAGPKKGPLCLQFQTLQPGNIKLIA